MSSCLLLLSLCALLFVAPSQASAEYDGGRIIDNDLFLNANSMSASDIQSFLASKGSGLASRSYVMQCSAAGATANQLYINAGAPCNQNTSAANMIYYASRIYGVNPQVILATIQKEQSLVTTGNPTIWQITQAMGYGCPTTGSCDTSSSFFYQIDNGTWVLRYHYERANGNNNWWSPSSGWVCGTEKNFYKPNLYPGQNVRFYDGNNVLYRTHFIENAATSAFYCYTPHAYNNPQGLYGRAAYGTTGQYYSGSYNFVTAFEQWFGSTKSSSYYSCRLGSNVAGAPTGQRVIGSKLGINNTDNLRLIIPNNTGSTCIEAHTWQNNNYQRWIQHIASNSPAADPTTQRILSADGNGDGVDEVFKVDYTDTSSGMIEVHVWDSSIQKWIIHAATNRPSVSLADSEVITGDPDGDGRDNTFLVQYRNTSSGRVEVHGWSPSLQQWTSHIATNYGVIDPINSNIITADPNGDGRDEFYLINYSGSSGRIEVHGWSPNFQQWISHAETISPSVTHMDGASNPIEDIIAADTNGDSREEFYKIDYSGTSSGRVEIHGLSPNFRQWTSHTATNQGAF